MKRRGFFGLVAGAAVAGPAMAKEAIGGMGLDALQVGSGSNMLSQSVAGYAAKGLYDTATANPISEVDMARAALKKLVGFSAAARSKQKRRMHVGSLDPDIASYRSIALHAKLDWQRERMLDAMLDERKTMWQRVAEGLGYGSEADDGYLP